MDSNLEAIKKHSTDNDDCCIGNAKLPLVSIIITNYNYSNFLEECIESCLNQDYTKIEIILVDDCSKDNSKEIYSKFSDKIKIIEHSENKGQLASFFTGLKFAKGEFVIFVDSDDFLDNDAISAHLYIHLFTPPPVGFTCLQNRQVSTNSAIINNYHLDFTNNGALVTYIAPRVIHTPTWSWSTTSAMCFRKNLLTLINTENISQFRVCADYYIVHFANLLGGSMLYNKVKVNYRRHGNNSFSKNFVIGGHKPTGHNKYHAHPSHEDLQKEILSKLIYERERFEPYYPSIERYAEAILYVAPLKWILKKFKIDNDLLLALKKQESIVEKEKKWQIRVKKWAIHWFKLQNRIKQIKVIKNNLLELYGTKER